LLTEAASILHRQARNGTVGDHADAIFEGMGEPGMKWIEVTGRGQRRYRTDEDE